MWLKGGFDAPRGRCYHQQTNVDKSKGACYTLDEVKTKKAVETVKEILRRGNDAKIRRHKNGVVIIEEKQTIKYRAD